MCRNKINTLLRTAAITVFIIGIIPIPKDYSLIITYHSGQLKHCMAIFIILRSLFKI